MKHDRDAIIKVTSCAICGSDIHLFDQFMPGMKKGDIVGHETGHGEPPSPRTRSLDRAFGKPRPTVEKPMSIEDRIAAMSPEERLERLRQLTDKAREMLEQHDGSGIIQIEARKTHGPDRDGF